MCYPVGMNLLLIILVLLLLFGGGGFYFGGPVIGGQRAWPGSADMPHHLSRGRIPHEKLTGWRDAGFCHIFRVQNRRGLFHVRPHPGPLLQERENRKPTFRRTSD